MLAFPRALETAGGASGSPSMRLSPGLVLSTAACGNSCCHLATFPALLLPAPMVSSGLLSMLSGHPIHTGFRISPPDRIHARSARGLRRGRPSRITHCRSPWRRPVGSIPFRTAWQRIILGSHLGWSPTSWWSHLGLRLRGGDRLPAWRMILLGHLTCQAPRTLAKWGWWWRRFDACFPTNVNKYLTWRWRWWLTACCCGFRGSLDRGRPLAVSTAWWQFSRLANPYVPNCTQFPVD